MACTVAVESVITDHYNDQIRNLLEMRDTLSDEEKEILEVITKCRDEEMEHHDTGKDDVVLQKFCLQKKHYQTFAISILGLEQDAEQAIGYDILSNVIKTGCKTAIWISERV